MLAIGGVIGENSGRKRNREGELDVGDTRRVDWGKRKKVSNIKKAENRRIGNGGWQGNRVRWDKKQSF